MKNDIILLRKVTQAKDSDGYDSAKSAESRTVFAERKSVTRTEFYEAMRAGITAAAVFCINADEYDGETEVQSNDKVYTVVRTYKTSENDIELTCADKKVI